MLIFFNNTQCVLQGSSETLVQTVYPDRWLFHTAPGPLWDAALSDIDGVVRSRLPGFIQEGNLTVQATAAKHAGQVWLCALSQIDIASRSISNHALHKGERSASPVKGYRETQPASRCDCCFKELSDTLTSLYSAAALLYSANFIFCPPLSPPRCFLSWVALIKCREPRRRLWFPIPDSYCGEGRAPCPRTRTPQIWSLTSEALSRWSCGVNHRVSPVERFKVFIASFTLRVWNINHLHHTSINVSAF